MCRCFVMLWCGVGGGDGGWLGLCGEVLGGIVGCFWCRGVDVVLTLGGFWDDFGRVLG